MSWNRLSTGLYSSLVLSCLVGSNGVAFGLYSIGAAFFIIDLSLLAMGLAHVGCGGMIIVCVGMYRHYPRIASVVLVIMHLVGIVFYSWLAIACFASSDQVDSWICPLTVFTILVANVLLLILSVGFEVRRGSLMTPAEEDAQ